MEVGLGGFSLGERARANRALVRGLGGGGGGVGAMVAVVGQVDGRLLVVGEDEREGELEELDMPGRGSCCDISGSYMALLPWRGRRE